MEALIKRVLYSSVGLVANTTDKVQQTVNNLREKEQENREYGKEVVDKFWKGTGEQKEEVEEKVKDTFENILGKFDLVTKSEYEELVEKIQKLEKDQKATVKSSSTKKTTTRKSAASKAKKTTAKAKATTKRTATRTRKAAKATK